MSNKRRILLTCWFYAVEIVIKNYLRSLSMCAVIKIDGSLLLWINPYYIYKSYLFKISEIDCADSEVQNIQSSGHSFKAQMYIAYAYRRFKW